MTERGISLENNIFTIFLLGFTSFFTLINPLGVMPIYLSLTSDLSDQMRVVVLKKSLLVAFIILILFALSGQLLFNFFNISVNSFRIVGGVIFFLMGMDMLQARLSKIEIKSSEVKKYVNDITITPLAIPLICGPGAITNAIVLMEDTTTIVEKIALLLALISVILITYLLLLSANKIYRKIGEVGNNVLMRLMGLIVMVIAVEFFIAGVRPIILSMK